MNETPQSNEAVKVFYSYSHKDERLRDALEEHLSLLKREGVISEWHDRRIGAGSEWGGEIDEHLKAADIILLLISASFIASDYCYDVEMKLAMERHEAGKARVVPVILRPCKWEKALFGKLNALPKNAKPVTKWGNRDDAFTDIANGIGLVTEELKAKRRAPVAATETAQPPAAPRPAASLIPRPPVVGFVARRDKEGRDIVGLLKDELALAKNQLVALWGPGGSGKTTLAAEVIGATKDSFGGRVVWASSLNRSDFGLATLLDEIATQLGREDLRRLAPEPKATQVAALVSEAPTLVILDNFETVPEEERARCLDFLAQSAACPVLITTRYVINRDEVYHVPLAAMETGEARDFLQRLVALTRKPSNFDRLDRDALITRCEANPLVLQWVVRQIDLAKRPQDVLDDLERGEGDAAERVFTRSFNLPQLGDDGRAALLALSLFTPSASREALAEVSGFGDDLRRLDKAVESLSSLWLVETTEGNERLFLRGLTRELAKSYLRKDERAGKFLWRFVEYYHHYSEAHSKPTPENLNVLEAEKDNIWPAMEVAFRLKDWRHVVQIHGVLGNFTFLRGYWDAAIRSGERAVAAARELNHEKSEFIVAAFTVNMAVIRSESGEYKEAEKVYREAIETFRKVGDENMVASCLHNLGIASREQGHLEAAQRLYEEGLTIWKGLDDQRGVAAVLHELGVIAERRGNLEEAHKLASDSLEISLRLGDQLAAATSLTMLGRIAYSQNDLYEARRLYSESLEIDRRFGNQLGIAHSLHGLGHIAEDEDNKIEAARLFREVLDICESLGIPNSKEALKDLARVMDITDGKE